MATTFINPPSPGSPVLTSALYSLKARTDKAKVEVEIVRDPGGEADSFFSTALYSFDGVVELSDIGSLIEERLRAKHRIWDQIEIRFDDVSAVFTALYCEYHLDSRFDHTQCFLCAAGTSVVHRNSGISLAHWPDGSDEYRVQIVGIDLEGNTAVAEHLFKKTASANHVTFPVNEIISIALGQGSTLASVSYFAISHGQMRKICYLVDHPFFLTFGFRNMFNAHEYLDVAGVVSRKTKYDRETAVCSGSVKQYDQTVERTYELQTGPLSDDQVRELEQLIGSHDIQLCAFDRTYDIIITDHSVEVSNDDDSLHSGKFTFRFTGDRPVLTPDDMGALMPSYSNIFTHEFTDEFA